jgi:hypothetical protein
MKRIISTLVRNRKEFLKVLELGEQDKATLYTEALDMWISVLNAQKEVKDNKERIRGQKEAETEASL